MLLAGIILIVIVYFMDLSPAAELTILLFFGVCSALYLVGRGKSFLLQYHAVVAKIAADEALKEAREDDLSAKDASDQNK